MDSKQLVAEATLALETYRRLLPPGLYFFGSEMVDGKRTGVIIETREDYTSKTQEEEFGVIFGFWPEGFVPQDLVSYPGKWLDKYSFVGGVSRLSQAPDCFLELLARYVNERIASQK